MTQRRRTRRSQVGGSAGIDRAAIGGAEVEGLFHLGIPATLPHPEKSMSPPTMGTKQILAGDALVDLEQIPMDFMHSPRA